MERLENMEQKETKRLGKRRPAELELAGGKGSRQRAWEAIRKHAGAFTCYQIARKAKVDDETMVTYLQSLQHAGYLAGEDMAGKPVRTRKTWTLVKDNGIEAPRVTRDGKPVTQGMGTEAMWRAMRIIGEFSGAELAAHASASGVDVSERTAKSYIGALKSARYLVVVKEAVSRGGRRGAESARYRMAPGKYTGPRPPMIQRTKSVYDPNLGKVVWAAEAENDDDL
jgi:hypothetical protein